MATWEDTVEPRPAAAPVDVSEGADAPAASGSGGSGGMGAEPAGGMGGDEPAVDAGDATSGKLLPSGRRDFVVRGVSHFDLVSSPPMRAALFAALGEAAAELVK